MTCVIGFVDGEGVVHLGADSGGFSNWDVTKRADEKIFFIESDNRFIIGIAGSFRASQIVRYDMSPPMRPDGITDMHYMVSHFVESLRQVLKDKGLSCVSENVESTDGGIFLVGYNGNLYEISSDFQVGKSIDGIAAIGCGANYCLGAFDALTDDEPPKERLMKSLKITANRCCGVAKPFRYLRSK